jgi:hypothetical protein
VISRRRLLAAGMVVPLGVGGATGRVCAQTGTQPKIGDSQASFDAWFGPGTGVEGFIHYPPVAAGRASYDVSFDQDGQAQTIVGNFHDLAGGGIPHLFANTREIGQSQFVPVDANAGRMARFGSYLHEIGVFGVRGWSRADSAGMGNVIVLDRLVRGDTPDEMLFKETIVTTESEALQPIVPTDTHLGPHSLRDVWEQYPGGVLLHQTGLDLQTPPVPGSWTISGDRPSIRVQLEQPLSMRDAAFLVGSMLPAAELEWSAWIPVTPITSWQLRLHQFRALDTGDQYLIAQFVDGYEAKGQVTRLDLVPAENN